MFVDDAWDKLRIFFVQQIDALEEEEIIIVNIFFYTFQLVNEFRKYTFLDMI